MQLKTGRFGKYFGCMNDNCGTTRALQRNGEPKPIVMEPIVTEIATLPEFYPAEDYHQDYYSNNSNAGYCTYVIRPKLVKLNLE